MNYPCRRVSRDANPNKCTFPFHPELAMSRIPLLAVVYSMLTLSSLASSAEPAPRKIDFNRDIRPILSDRCFHCHGPDAKHREADLRLDTEQGAKADLGGYHAIVPGNLDESMLIERIMSDDPDERMPPPDSGKKLSPREKELLKRWVAEGAAWSQHWAYEPPRRHPLPEVKDRDWPLNWVDRFVLARLEEEGLKPNEPADRRTLIRRLSFDLTGLPPSPEQVQQFLADEQPGAYERVVDRLLASPHFGERMAMYWLDLVRYADTVGYHGDQDHNASPYRDWVIESFNRNLPFDDFTRAQLAGDLLPDATLDDKIASAYNRLLQTSHEGGVQPKEYLAIYAADRVRNVSAVWMGATVGCAQCHDHKYDPYTTKDFYSLGAFFADVDEEQHFRRGSNSLPTNRPPEIPVLSRREREIAKSLEVRIAALHARLERLPADSEDRSTLQVEIERLRKHRAAIDKQARKVMITVAKSKPRVMRLLPRGNWLDDSGAVVEPAIPTFLGELAAERRASRLDLANWLVDAGQGAGGLTARVQVNRLWYLFFGSGLAADLGDFGGQGQPPEHPELLDNLAIEFAGNDWNVKRLVRLIVTSRAYRQSSAASAALVDRDPYNRLFARQSSYRLPAEMVRDNALTASGLLERDLGGASVKPYQPAGYYRHLNFPTRRYNADRDRRQWRRGLYIHWQRQFLHPMLRAFDAPSREECTAERAQSNTPLAALVLLNDPTFVEAARGLATRAPGKKTTSDPERLDRMYRLVVSRPADEFERRLLLELLAASRKRYRADAAAAEKLLAVGISPRPQHIPTPELAAWTTIARAVMNLNETMTRN